MHAHVVGLFIASLTATILHDANAPADLRWHMLLQCAGVKSFIVNLVIARSSNEETYRAQKLFMSKLNVILVQIVKQEWPHNWPR